MQITIEVQPTDAMFFHRQLSADGEVLDDQPVEFGIRADGDLYFRVHGQVYRTVDIYNTVIRALAQGDGA